MTETNKTGGIVMLKPDERLINPPNPAGFSLPHIAARFFDTPLLIQPDKIPALAWALRGKLNLNVEQPEGGVMDASGPGLFGENMDQRGGYYVDRGVAVIPIRGTLVNRGGWIGASSGLTSYEGISKQLDMVSSDDRVQAVMFDINSYGGEATGIDDLGRMIHAMTKPTYAMIDGHGTSAAYWLAAPCRRVYIANSSHGGSIGVVITHASYEGALESAGINVTHIHAGANKVLGSPYRNLSDSDREQLQAKVERTYSAFVQAIAAFRGMDTEAIRATEANVYEGPEMVQLGLADGVTTSRRLLAAIQDDFENPDPDRESPSGNSRTIPTSRGNAMTTNADGGANPAAETFTRADLDARLAEQVKQQKIAVEKATTEATAAERQRISAILGSDAAKARPALAHKLALSDQGYLAEAAAEILEAASEESTQADPLAAAMAGRSPGVSSDDGSDTETSSAPVTINAADIYARRAAVGK